MAEARALPRWLVLPCVESTARADWLFSLRLEDTVTLLPPALESTLAYRAASDSPDVIVIAAGAAFLGRLAQDSAVRRVLGHIPTLLLAEPSSASLVRQAARLKAASLLPRELSSQQLAAAIAAVALGLQVALPRPVPFELDRTTEPEHLTAREGEVLRLMARGYRNKQVAVRLNISQHTAKAHVSSVISKLGARTRTEAVTIGVTRGLVAI